MRSCIVCTFIDIKQIWEVKTQNRNESYKYFFVFQNKEINQKTVYPMEATLLKTGLTIFCRRLSRWLTESIFKNIIFFSNQWKRKPKKRKESKLEIQLKRPLKWAVKRGILNLTNGECWTDCKIKNLIQWVEPIQNFWKKVKKRRHEKKNKEPIWTN